MVALTRSYRENTVFEHVHLYTFFFFFSCSTLFVEIDLVTKEIGETHSHFIAASDHLLSSICLKFASFPCFLLFRTEVTIMLWTYEMLNIGWLLCLFNQVALVLHNKKIMMDVPTGVRISTKTFFKDFKTFLKIKHNYNQCSCNLVFKSIDLKLWICEERNFSLSCLVLFHSNNIYIYK